jgi:hypothetical protein
VGGCGADLVLAGDPARLDLRSLRSLPPFLAKLEGAGRRWEADVEVEGEALHLAALVLWPLHAPDRVAPLAYTTLTASKAQNWPR